jgi:hypothetical protein
VPQPSNLDRSKADTGGSVAALWRRAPLWRTTVGVAALATTAGVICWAELDTPAPSRDIVPMTAAHETQNHLIAAANPPSTPDTASRSPPPAVNERIAIPAIPGALSDSLSAEEEQTLASCHPHLLLAPPAMPQVDVNGVQQPNLAHIKIHFWVNGAGAVTRTLATEVTYGTPAEQQAEIEYVKALTFSVPNTADCRSRQMELIGDISERRDAAGTWASYARLYPHLAFGANGALMRLD